MFTDQYVGYDWDHNGFDSFQVCYDYYTGDQGMCAWQPGQINFLADRGPNLYRYLQGFVDYVCVDDSRGYPVPTQETTWGRVKSLYK